MIGLAATERGGRENANARPSKDVPSKSCSPRKGGHQGEARWLSEVYEKSTAKDSEGETQRGKEGGGPGRETKSGRRQIARRADTRGECAKETVEVHLGGRKRGGIKRGEKKKETEARGEEQRLSGRNLHLTTS